MKKPNFIELRLPRRRKGTTTTIEKHWWFDRPYIRLCVACGAFIALLLVAGVVFGQTEPFSDNFEAYTTGSTIGGQGDWTSGSCTISETEAHDGVKSLKCLLAGGQNAFGTGDSRTSGTWYWWAWSMPNSTQLAYIANASDIVFGSLVSIDFGGANPAVKWACGGISWIYFTTYFDRETWLKVGIQWSDAADEIRCYVDGEWSDWVSSASGFVDEVSKIGFGNGGSYLDGLGTICDSTCLYCSPIECAGRQDCTYILPLSSCVPKEPSCGEYFGCSYCFDEGSCNCWSSCFWSEDTCIWGEPTATTSDFMIYYAENTEFATPTAWALAVANSIGGIFNKAGAFVQLLSVSSTEAVSLGLTIGSAVPTIRGYLLAIISFFEGLGTTLPLWDFLKIEIGVIVLLIVIKVIMMIRRFIF